MSAVLFSRAVGERRRAIAERVVQRALQAEAELVGLYDAMVEANCVDRDVEASLFQVQRALVSLRVRAASVR